MYGLTFSGRSFLPSFLTLSSCAREDGRILTVQF